jgi:hypothetical protein
MYGSFFKNISLIFFICAACTEKYNLDLKDHPQKLVIEGLITDQKGPYFVRLTKSNPEITFPDYQDTISGYRIRKTDTVNALIIAIDVTTGFTDTLVHSPDSIWYHNSPDDSILRGNVNGGYNGYYQTTSLKGIAGHLYALQVRWKNIEYHASCFLPSVPKIDSITFKYTQGEPGKDDYYIPLIFFKEPQNEINYYLFFTRGSGNSIWPYAVLSDNYLNAYVNGLDVFKGMSPDYWMNGYPSLNQSFSIEMHSITTEVYDYYNALIQQFKNDGGIYSPAPSSPPSNIDNDALGLFRASSISRIDTILNIDNSNY